MLAVTGTEIIRMLEDDKDGDILQKLKAHARLFSNNMKTLDQRFTLQRGEGDSPLFLLSLKERLDSRLEEEKLLQEIAEQVRDNILESFNKYLHNCYYEQCLKDGFLIVRSKYVLDQEHKPPPASLKICVSAGHSKRDVERVAVTLREACKRVAKKL
jgi:serine palmitoyltransferase